ncbi:MAG TPA: FHA domain-containing protein [Armatimonadota bacterium]|jgi:hypothetical protein
MSHNRVEISFDGDDEQPKPPAPEAEAPTPGANRIVITADDLRNAPDRPAAPPRPMVPGPMGYGPGKTKTQYPSGVSAQALAPSAIAGLVGGAVAWALSEAMVGWQSETTSMGQMIAAMGGFGALMGGVIGMCLGAAEGIEARAFQKAAMAALVGLAIGAGGGFVGGAIGQLCFGVLIGSGQPSLPNVMLARIVGWSIVGTCIGLGQGIGRGSGKRVVNGVLGGLIGGFAAGVMFDPIGMVTRFGAGDTGTMSRAVGITVLGVAAGLAIGLVDQMRKEAWLSVTSGPLAGKQFILYEQRTRLGSSPKCEITLFKDPGVSPEQAVIEDRGSERVLMALDAQNPPAVNGQPVRATRLAGGCVITLGSTTLLYEEKAVGPYPGM